MSWGAALLTDPLKESGLPRNADLGLDAVPHPIPPNGICTVF